MTLFRKNELYLILFLIFFAACSSSKSKFSKKDVKSSQRIMGLEFDKKYIDTLYPYLEKNRQGFDSLRTYDLSNEVFPAVRFNPLPATFIPRQQSGFPDWEVPDGIELPKNKSELAFYTIPQLASLIQHKKISSLELTQFFLERLKKYNPILECTISITEKLALEQAKKMDDELAAGNYRGILHGIPYGVKDLMAVEGYKTTWGAAPYRNQTIDMTATVVETLQ